MAATLKTVVLTGAVLIVFAIVFSIQIDTGIGPAGALTRETAGSPEWFAAARRWVAIETYLVWPLLIVAGAVLQRRWCRGSPAWSVIPIAAPAVVAQFSRQPSDLLLCAAYIALAQVTGVAFTRWRGATYHRL